MAINLPIEFKVINIVIFVMIHHMPIHFNLNFINFIKQNNSISDKKVIIRVNLIILIF